MQRSLLALLLVFWLADTARADSTASAAGAHLKLELPETATAGEPFAVSLTITPEGRGEIDRDAGVRVDLRADADPASRTLSLRDAVDPRAESPRFEIQLRAERPGQIAVELRARLWICTGRSCVPQDLRSAGVLQVEAPEGTTGTQ
jgi:hypothetical protein